MILGHRQAVVLATTVCLGMMAGGLLAAEVDPIAAGTSLEKGFVEPPLAARPWVYWFWLNGNITREGITADLEAMQRVGIGGVLIMEVDQGAPVGPVGFMSPEWRQLFRHAVAEAGRLGLEINMNNDAGWNGSGGPWIKPEQSMQKVVWSEATVAGPKRVELDLRQPTTVAGYYRDIAVLAFPSVGNDRIDQIEVKAGYRVGRPARAVPKELPPEMRIDRDRIVDLTARMDKHGHLAWNAPAGRWTILRFGHTSTGVQNAPAPASGRGLECDKLSQEGAEAAFRGMMGPLAEDAGPAVGKTLVATHVDSWENGSQNWTARMREEFRTRRGYDLTPYLPVMTGRVVGGLEVSERFLWDLRRTISELVVANYAGHLRDLAHRHGLRFTIEAYGSPCDHLPYAGVCDEPMGEFWVGGGALGSCRGMASAAHTYGKPIIGAEAFTATDHERWRDHPGTVKALGDQAFCEGINRFVFHRYAMQPWLDRRPGMTMGPWGLHYERTQTWWDLTPDWHRYLARCQFLLRQGRFVADIGYLEPEDSPQGFQDHPRNGYGWDQVSPEVVLTRMSVRDGRLVLPDGMSYRLLALSDDRAMTPGLLRKLKELVEAGATIVGPRPLRSPSLNGYPACDDEVRRLADALWGDCDGKSVQERRLGSGRVVWGRTPEKVLAETAVRPDFASPARLRFLHRQLNDMHLYFVANPAPGEIVANATFRVGGKRPELWWPDTGRIEPAAMFHQEKDTTTVHLALEPSGSVFVVFRDETGSLDPAVTLARDGKTLYSTRLPAPKIVVQKAVYGVLGDATRQRDVREKVQRLVDAGETLFPVAKMAEDGDPARNVVKTLVVDYRIDDRSFVVKACDGEMLHVNRDAVTITVEKAVYGVLQDPARTRDMREKIQRMADAGEDTFQVARLAAGDDPAPMVVKTLVLEYRIAGKRRVVTATDPETIVLSQPPASPRLAEVRVASDGKWHLETRQPGRFAVERASGKTLHAVVEDQPPAVELAGSWEVAFPQADGSTKRISLERLASWSEQTDKEVKYFSGTATYRKAFAVPATLLGKQRRIELDLGDVEAIARVRLNGRDFGVLWKRPFCVDATDAIRAGENQLEVQVTNLWPNRLIGDEHLPDDSLRNPNGTLKEWPAWLQEGKPSPTGRQTFTTWRLWKKDDPLLQSGLLGPVRLAPVGIARLEE